jgi:hypothetical protein
MTMLKPNGRPNAPFTRFERPGFAAANAGDDPPTLVNKRPPSPINAPAVKLNANVDIVSAPAFFSDVATAAANVSGGVFASDACTVTSLRDRVVVKAASRPFPMSATFWSAKKLDSRLNVEDDTFWWPGLFSNVEAAVAVILLFAVALTLGASVPRRAGAMMVARVVIMICVFIFARFGYNSFNVTHLSSTHTARRLLPSASSKTPRKSAFFLFSKIRLCQNG